MIKKFNFYKKMLTVAFMSMVVKGLFLNPCHAHWGFWDRIKNSADDAYDDVRHGAEDVGHVAKQGAQDMYTGANYVGHGVKNVVNNKYVDDTGRVAADVGVGALEFPSPLFSYYQPFYLPYHHPLDASHHLKKTQGA